MASIMVMPVEVILEIVNQIVDETLIPPIVGEDAAWVIPADSSIMWKPSLGERIVHGLHWKSSQEAKQIEEETTKLAVMRRHCSLKALRLTNRFFDQICQPFLYRRLNLLSDLTRRRLKMMKEVFSVTRWSRTTGVALSVPKWSFIQSISVYVDPTKPIAFTELTEQAANVVVILALCPNITALALYYHHNSVQMMILKDVLLSMLKGGRLSSLGFYSRRLLQDPSGRDQSNGEVGSLVHLLYAIALYEPAQRSLRIFDVVADWIPAAIFDLIRSNFTSLTSLTLRRVVRTPWFLSRIWDVDQRSKWHSYPNLTRLQLSHFQPGHAAQIPSLVLHFKALKELTISACGDDNNFVLSPRTSGWSRRPEALCNIRTTLDWMHLEHMDDWEMYELGIIPTSTLIVTTVKKNHLLQCFQQDAEIFPGLHLLRLTPLTPAAQEAENEVITNGKPSISSVCKMRAINLRRDAVAHWTCVCGFDGGY